LIFKQLEIIGEKFFKLTDAVNTISGGSDGNDFEWWQRKNSPLILKI
jgi:hypothetical protein